MDICVLEEKKIKIKARGKEHEKGNEGLDEKKAEKNEKV